MIKLFNDISQEFSKLVTIRYSTSFSLATKTLNSSIRNLLSIFGHTILDLLLNKDKHSC